MNQNNNVIHINNTLSVIAARNSQLKDRPDVLGLSEKEAIALCCKLGFPYQVYYDSAIYYSERQPGVLNMLIKDSKVTTSGYMT